MGKEKSKDHSLETDLMAALDFTVMGLGANQDGHLSQQQKTRLQYERKQALLFAIPISLVVIPIALLFLAYNVRHPAEWGYGGIGLGLLLGFTLIPFRRAIRLTRDLRANRVEAVQGYVSLDMNGSQCSVTIGNQTWQVNKNVFLAFKNGDPYCLYYLPHSRTLLSAEWLREE
ncbi:MAG TPA: hypothetical protein VHO69_15890 [Phototrophicaceae bacterium]|nr:hypothetical protein [Phototrophicaceae bacterium]